MHSVYVCAPDISQANSAPTLVPNIKHFFDLQDNSSALETGEYN